MAVYSGTAIEEEDTHVVEPTIDASILMEKDLSYIVLELILKIQYCVPCSKIFWIS